MTTIESIMRKYNCSWSEARRILMNNPRKYLYSALPEACICHSCGYVLRSPKTHCRELTCPKCGKQDMWRKR